MDDTAQAVWRHAFFSVVVVLHWIVHRVRPLDSIFEMPDWLHGLENVTKCLTKIVINPTQTIEETKTLAENSARDPNVRLNSGLKSIGVAALAIMTCCF